jgi:predicted nucleic acid-binding protein
VILLDTNVLSEALKAQPNSAVVTWLDRNFDDCALCSVVLFEMKAGAALLCRGRRRDMLDRAIDRTTARFGARFYNFDSSAALAAARIIDTARDKALPIQQSQKLADLQLAGIATAYGLELATRNTKDFRGLGLTLIDPWRD